MTYMVKIKKVIYLVCWVFFIIIIPFFLASSINKNTFYIRVNSNSMYPTVRENDKLLVSNNYKKIYRNDIIVFYSVELNKILIKRVIGVPGDTIYIDENNNFIINDSILIEGNGLYNDDSYIYREAGINKKIEIEGGRYFVIGDNIDNSLDSRLWRDTFISDEIILGKVVLLLEPIKRFSVFY